MFKEIKTEKGFRKLNTIGGKLEKVTITMPADTDVFNVQKYLEQNVFESKVQYDYAKRILVGYNYAKNSHHKITNNLLLNDVNNNKRIYIHNYM